MKIDWNNSSGGPKMSKSTQVCNMSHDHHKPTMCSNSIELYQVFQKLLDKNIYTNSALQV